MTTRICMWSGPRNLSTAMMRSFGSRVDCSVIDEPFFAPFLKVSGKEHPGRAETLLAHETDPGKIAELCESPIGDAPISFQKHMPHHMVDEFPLDWMQGAKHFFLIRDPARVIASYAKGRAEFTLEDLGYPQLTRFYELIGKDVPILDCDDILQNPERILHALCTKLEIVFDPAMLSWQAGKRETDGAWAPYWYKSVENSTGFSSPPAKLPEVDNDHRVIYDLAKRDYDIMFAKRLCA